ncbi:MAG: amidohydrolase [Chloroflexi bacterium]|nr:amidohydrolase [Chloroflexota bacterium]
MALRRSIHREPELGLDLPLTQAKVLDALNGLPLDIHTGRKTTSVVADLRGAKPGKTIILRGDMDALPLQEDTGLPFASEHQRKMHACGHDAHTAMLASAARLLASRQSELSGTVRFMFQPGEEGYRGAQVMLDEGLLDGDPAPSAAFALHSTPRWAAGTITTRPGPVLASADSFRIIVTGRGGHASAPHLSADPIPVACEIVTALQTFVTRSVSVFEPGVVTVGKIEAGTTHNIIPETATLTGTVRTVSPATRRHIVSNLNRVAQGIADAHGVRAETIVDEGYPVTVNDVEFARFVLDVARSLVGPECAPEQATPQMAAEDFSYVLERVPGAMVSLGTRPSGMSEAEAPAGHSNRYLLEEEAMVNGTAMYAAVALEYLTT